MPLETVPIDALRLTELTPLTFADVGELKKGDTVPVSMIARTGDSISHWYWGDVVHDLQGMTLAGNNATIDYSHDSNQVMGFLNRFNADADLEVAGSLVMFADGDKVDEVVTKARAGVQYQASIDFSGGDLEISRYNKGEKVNVNGRDFSGPITVIDRWQLRAVAITPYGADPNTSTSLSANGESQPVIVNDRGTKPMTLSEMLQAAAGDAKLNAVAKWGESAGLPIADGFAIFHGLEVECHEKAAGRFIEASGIEAGWTWPDTVTFSTPEPAIAAEGADRKEAATFERMFGLAGVQVWSQGGSLEDAATAWRDEHTKVLESAEEEIKRLTAEVAALKLSDPAAAAVGDDPNATAKPTMQKKFQDRADGLATQK